MAGRSSSIPGRSTGSPERGHLALRTTRTSVGEGVWSFGRSRRSSNPRLASISSSKRHLVVESVRRDTSILRRHRRHLRHRAFAPEWCRTQARKHSAEHSQQAKWTKAFARNCLAGSLKLPSLRFKDGLSKRNCLPPSAEGMSVSRIQLPFRATDTRRRESWWSSALDPPGSHAPRWM